MEWIDANTFFGTWHHRRLDAPPEELVRLLKAAGTSRAMTLSLMAPLLEAEEGTADTLLASKAHRELIPFGAVDPRRYTGGDKVKKLHALGCAAVRLTNGINGYPLDASTVDVILRECAAVDLTVFLDVTAAGQPTLIERLAESTGCRIVMLGMHHLLLSEAVVSMKRSKQLFVETSRLNTPDALRLLSKAVGADRVLFGSGAPFNYAACARMVAEHQDLSEDELGWIASGTLRSLLREEYRS